jgi:erythronate-4-phosphate dehydrogenase
MNEQELLAKAIWATYDIRTDDADLRKNPEWFEKLRGDYPVRREYPVFTVRCTHVDASVVETLKALGFNVTF